MQKLGPARCPHCDCHYDYVKHIKERLVALKVKGKPIIQAEIEKYCNHCENRWIHTYDATMFHNSWVNCAKSCDCGFKEIHKPKCASKELT